MKYSIQATLGSLLVAFALNAAAITQYYAHDQVSYIDDPFHGSYGQQVSYSGYPRSEHDAEEMMNEQADYSMASSWGNNARLTILVDKAPPSKSPKSWSTAQTMKVYLDGQLIHKFVVSTGSGKMVYPKDREPYRAITPAGVWRITKRVKNYVSETWDVEMPYAQFFGRSKRSGIAIHGIVSQKQRNAMGTPASAGCVRVHTANAIKLWKLVDQVGDDNVAVLVYDSRDYKVWRNQHIQAGQY